MRSRICLARITLQLHEMTISRRRCVARRTSDNAVWNSDLWERACPCAWASESSIMWSCVHFHIDYVFSGWQLECGDELAGPHYQGMPSKGKMVFGKLLSSDIGWKFSSSNRFPIDIEYRVELRVIKLFCNL